MPDAPDGSGARSVGGDGPSEPKATLIGAASDRAGFLDAPDLDLDGLIDAVARAFTLLAPGAVLTVFSRAVTGASLEARYETGGTLVISTITHQRGGTTFTLRLSG